MHGEHVSEGEEGTCEEEGVGEVEGDVGLFDEVGVEHGFGAHVVFVEEEGEEAEGRADEATVDAGGAPGVRAGVVHA